jgi:hypothetical protein
MEVFCTSIVPIKFYNAEIAREFIFLCKEKNIISDYKDYRGELNLKTINDVNANFLQFFYIPSSETDVQCAFYETTLTIVLTRKNSFDDYYKLVNQSLSERKRIVKRVLELESKDQKLKPFMDFLKSYRDRGFVVNYAFTFHSICDESFMQSCERHLKVLAEPSIINMDDMLSSLDSSITYDSKTRLNNDRLKLIKDVDIYNDQKTYVTWASIVSLSKNHEIFIRNHICLVLFEVLIQRTWNLCYSQNIELNNSITDIKTYSTDINSKIIETYQILIESKNCISATYSSRLSSLYSAIVESSQLPKYISDLEQKLDYLIVFANTINQDKNRSIQESSEILLFMIAFAQVVPLFFNIPITTHYMISMGTVVFICLLGVFLIRFKYRR